MKENTTAPKPKPRTGKAGKREDLPIKVRSSWEANYYRLLLYLQEQGEIFKFTYEDREYEFPVKRGTTRYLVDFTVWPNSGNPGVFYHVELKGYMDSKSQTALRRMIKYYPDIEIRLIDNTTYRHLASIWSKIVPNWE